MASILARFNLQRKPIPAKKKEFEIKIPLKVAITDKRDVGYNRQDLKQRLLTREIKRKEIKRKVKKAEVKMVVKVKKKRKGRITLGKSLLTGTITDFIQLSEKEISQDLKEIDMKLKKSRLPKVQPSINIRASTYFMNNREIFINFINSLFEPYREDILNDKTIISCEKKERSFSLLTHQKIVRDYINNYTPYRGILLYHGLGSGKTCSSIAIAEGLKTEKKIIVMTPASLKVNYIEELKKCGDPLYRFNQFWEFIPIEKRLRFGRKYIQNFIVILAIYT